MIYRKILTNEDMITLQRDVDRLGEWAVDNAMKINPFTPMATFADIPSACSAPLSGCEELSLAK